MAASCLSSRSDQVKAALEKEVEAQDVGHKCKVTGVGCLGLCKAGPLVSVEPQGRLYQNVTPEDAGRLVGEPRRRARRADLLGDLAQPFFTRAEEDRARELGRHRPRAHRGLHRARRLLGAGRRADADDARSASSQQVQRSGLRGRGGAGYPTGLKWSTVAKARAPRKYVICNADEGDPGAFMDRSVLESDPHRVLEGMAIAGYAVGAQRGLHLRARRVPAGGQAPEDSPSSRPRSSGLLGQDICGTTFNFKIDIRLGAGAFVCGEETALIASVEGKPRHAAPAPAVPGGSRACGACPTLINNVETFANIPPIIRNGGDWFAAIGTAKSKGTKVFALAGPRQQHRPDRSADGHHAARDRSSTSAAASPTAERSRPCRPAAPPAAASPRSSSTCPSTTSRSARSARSWARAA